MSFFDRCKRFTAKVNRGSGVLFQPMTNEYSYILTAKHTLYHDEETMQKPIEDHIIEAISAKIIFLEKYEHQELDIAILKIEKVDSETPLKEFAEASKDNRYELYGYPGYKRIKATNLDEQVENFDVSISKTSENIITLDNPKFATIGEIKGVSGGGVFREDGESIYLVAIEYEMNAKTGSVATHQRIDSISIRAFDEIIEQNQSELEPLYPPFMNNFNLLTEHIFLLTGLMVEKEKVTNILKSVVETQVKDAVTPKQIFDKYNIGLLTKDEYKSELTNKELWTRYLEFLVISYLIDAKCITLDEIDVIYKRRKFLFAKTDDWTGLIKELLSYDIKSLEKDGTVCIACDKDITPDMCEIPPELLKKINHIPPIKMQINDGLSNPTEEIKIQHIHNFQREFIKKQTLLIGLDIQKIEERITDEAKNIFKKN